MTRKLALSDEILMQVEKPARYIGNEVNSVIKEKEKIEQDADDHSKNLFQCIAVERHIITGR